MPSPPAIVDYAEHAKMTGMQVYLRLLGYLRGYLIIFLFSILGLMLFSAMEVAFVDLFGYTINVVNSLASSQAEMPGNVDLGGGSTAWLVELISGDQALSNSRWIIPLLMFGIAVFRGLGFFVGNYCMNYVTQIIVHNLRMQLFDKYTRLPSSYFDKNMSGQLIARITYHVTQVTNSATSSLKVLIRESVLVLGLLAYLFYLNWRLTAIFVLVLPLIGLIVVLVSKRFRKLSQRIQSSMGDVTHVTQEVVGGFKEMHLYGGTAHEYGRMDKASNYYRRQHLKMAVAEGLSSPIIQMLVAMTISFLMWLALDPSVLANMTGGEFVKFLGSAGLLAKPIRQLSGINSSIQKGIAAASTIFATLNEKEERNEGTVVKDRVEGRLIFEDVVFSYDTPSESCSDDGGVSSVTAPTVAAPTVAAPTVAVPPVSSSSVDDEPHSSPVLNGINLSVNPGEVIALVGHSGSGKSTLVNLIPRFYNYQSGSITLDGVALEDYRLDNLRQHIAFVSQRVTLFNGTILDNIAYGDLANKSEAEVRAAAKAAHALAFIEALPEGFNTVTGDDGSTLSGGQRQRIAIARAILKDAPILIMDEATSALDTESEFHIQQALEQVMKGRTTFVIAHRLSTIENADRILVMDKGKIVEEGTHEELLSRGGRYTQLHEKSFDEVSS